MKPSISEVRSETEKDCGCPPSSPASQISVTVSAVMLAMVNLLGPSGGPKEEKATYSMNVILA